LGLGLAGILVFFVAAADDFMTILVVVFLLRVGVGVFLSEVGLGAALGTAGALGRDSRLDFLGRLLLEPTAILS